MTERDILKVMYVVVIILSIALYDVSTANEWGVNYIYINNDDYNDTMEILLIE